MAITCGIVNCQPDDNVWKIFARVKPPRHNTFIVDPLFYCFARLFPPFGWHEFKLMMVFFSTPFPLEHLQLALVTMTIISMVAAQKFPERTKLKFRPPGEWFESMQGPAEQSPSYFEQSDQPALEGQFQDLFVDDDDPEADSQFTGGSKFARHHPSMAPAVFQSLCPTKRNDISLDSDSKYEYRPSSYREVLCEFFWRDNEQNFNVSL